MIEHFIWKIHCFILKFKYYWLYGTKIFYSENHLYEIMPYNINVWNFKIK